MNGEVCGWTLSCIILRYYLNIWRNRLRIMTTNLSRYGRSHGRDSNQTRFKYKGEALRLEQLALLRSCMILLRF
jgi:hypothetical protein